MKNNSKNPAGNATRPAPKKGKKGFQKGESGNPGGRPKGSKNKLSRLAYELLEANAEEIIIASMDNAKAGDSTAQRFWLERIIPLVRSKTVPILIERLMTER
ncbi:MAG: hypothetical protein HQ513_15665 [Rhodospirillales bacterium]|nr:hypothetical protein [Rhodospirillales bacterium]